MPEPHPVPDALIPLPGSAVPDTACQVCLDLRPDGFTLLAHVRLDREADASLPEVGLADRDRQLLETTLQRVDQFLVRVQEQCHRALLADPWEENFRLRAALEECIASCTPLVERAEEGCCEGCEADQARAWLALDAARRALNAGPHLPGLPAAP